MIVRDIFPTIVVWFLDAFRFISCTAHVTLHAYRDATCGHVHLCRVGAWHCSHSATCGYPRSCPSSIHGVHSDIMTSLVRHVHDNFRTRMHVRKCFPRLFICVCVVRIVFGMAPTIDAALKQKICTLLKDAQSGQGLLKNMNQIYGLLRSHGLMWQSLLHCRFLGVHESNRDGLGISPDHVHKLCVDIYEFGFVEGESRRMAVELHGANGEATKEYNEKLVNQSNNLLLHSKWITFVCWPHPFP